MHDYTTACYEEIYQESCAIAFEELDKLLHVWPEIRRDQEMVHALADLAADIATKITDNFIPF